MSHLPPCFLPVSFKLGIGTIYFDGIDAVVLLPLFFEYRVMMSVFNHC